MTGAGGSFDQLGNTADTTAASDRPMVTPHFKTRKTYLQQDKVSWNMVSEGENMPENAIEMEAHKEESIDPTCIASERPAEPRLSTEPYNSDETAPDKSGPCAVHPPPVDSSQQDKEQSQRAKEPATPRRQRTNKLAGRNVSFIDQKHKPDAKKSLAYSVETVLWLVYHSLVLAFLPAVLGVIVFGSTWFFEINYRNVLYHYIITNSIFIMCMYLCVASLCIYVFGKERSKRLVYTLSIPSAMIHIVFYTARQVYIIPMLSLIYYGIFVVYCFAMLRKISLNTEAIEATEPGLRNRYDILSSDGTPMAIFKGYIPFYIFFYVLSNYLIPYFMKAGLFLRIIARVAVFPFMFNIMDTYQNNLLIYKSKKEMKYRIIFGNIINFISLAILRLMITDSPNIKDTTTMAVLSSISEVIFRTTFMIRAIYTMKFLQYLKKKVHSICINRGKVQNIGHMPSTVSYATQDEENPPDQQRPTPSASSTAQKNNAFSNDFSSVEDDKLQLDLSHKTIKQLIRKMHRKDSITNYLVMYRLHRSTFVSMCEIQLVVFVSIILYLTRPIHDYVRFETFSSVRHMGLSIMIQLFIELVTQLVSFTLENYFYGLEIKVSKSWKYNMKPALILQATLLLLMSLFLSATPFRPSPDSWPKD